MKVQVRGTGYRYSEGISMKMFYLKPFEKGKTPSSRV